MSETTPTPFDWPSGPSSVQVSGDWDGWKDRVDLDKEADGSFHKKIPLPFNTKHQYKYIVDGQWTTKTSSPIIDADGNQNNIVEVGSASTGGTESAHSKAAEIGADTAAGATGAGAAAATMIVGAGADPNKSADHANVGEEKKIEAVGVKKELSNEEKKAEPAAGLKNAADEDIRNQVPTSVTNATHGAMPIIASAVATVTGADILRGNSEALSVSQKEINDTQAQALKGDNAALNSRLEPQGGIVSKPAEATTDNAKAASLVANNATTGAPIVPVTNNGFAANITGNSGVLTTVADQNKEGGEKGGAVAAASAGVLGAAAAGGVAATAAKSNDDALKVGSKVDAPFTATKAPITLNSAEQTRPIATTTGVEPLEAKIPSNTSVNSAAEPIGAKSTPGDKPATLSAPISAAGGIAATSDSKSPPSVGPKDSKIQADKATAPAAASSPPLARGKETTTPAAAPLSASATAPKPKAAAANTKDKVSPSTPAKKPVPKASDTIQDTKAKSATNTSTNSAVNSNNSKPANVSPSTAKVAAASPASSAPATPERKKKTGLFGKIKQALSPHGSPDK